MKQQISPFIEKLLLILADQSSEGLMEWTRDEDAIIILNIAQFTDEILPKHFKHRNFSSFVRQLNIYGFFKASNDENIYKHELFKKGSKKALYQIHRRGSTVGQDQMLKKKNIDHNIRGNEYSQIKNKYEITLTEIKRLQNANKRQKLAIEELKRQIFHLHKQKQAKLQQLKRNYENEEKAPPSQSQKNTIEEKAQFEQIEDMLEMMDGSVNYFQEPQFIFL